MMRTSNVKAVLCGAVVLMCTNSGFTASAVELLVYDHGSEHHFAATAAAGIDPTPTIANSGNFNSLLASQPWGAVFIDAPGTIPTGGWTSTISFIQAGGKVAMSFWDWDNDDLNGDLALLPAFGITGTSSFSLVGRTLTNAGTTSVFTGVTMPNSDWHDHWLDDGDAFGFTIASGTVPVAYLSGFADPVMALGNGGRTVAAFVIDEAGTTWQNNGSAVRLWANMYNTLLVPEPSSCCLLMVGLAVLLTRARPNARVQR